MLYNLSEAEKKINLQLSVLLIVFPCRCRKQWTFFRWRKFMQIVRLSNMSVQHHLSLKRSMNNQHTPFFKHDNVARWVTRHCHCHRHRQRHHQDLNGDHGLPPFTFGLPPPSPLPFSGLLEFYNVPLGYVAFDYEHEVLCRTRYTLFKIPAC